MTISNFAQSLATFVLKDRVVNFWQALNIFNPNQFGFLEGKSTLTQLLCYFDWASSRNKSRLTDVIFLDFSEAFDSVLHEWMLLKLKCHGINGSLLRWFRSFLTDDGLPMGSLFPSKIALCSHVPTRFHYLFPFK